MYKHILVPIDGSETSDLALKQALELAKQQGAELRLIYVGDEMLPYASADTSFSVNKYKTLVREAGERLLSECANTIRSCGIVFGTKYAAVDSLRDRICHVISEEANRWPADLIVIGTHGRRGFNRLLLGSVAEGVIRTASKPVLIVRGGYREDQDASLLGS